MDSRDGSSGVRPSSPGSRGETGLDRKSAMARIEDFEPGHHVTFTKKFTEEDPYKAPALPVERVTGDC